MTISDVKPSSYIYGHTVKELSLKYPEPELPGINRQLCSGRPVSSPVWQRIHMEQAASADEHSRKGPIKERSSYYNCSVLTAK